MKKTTLRNCVVLVASILVVIVLASCDQESPQLKTGSLSVSIRTEKEIASRNLASGDSDPIEITSYSIRGSGPNGNSFSNLASTQKTMIINNLLWGDWTITATGYNDLGNPVAEGVVETRITSGENQVTVDLTTALGSGSLDFTCSWEPSQVGASPILELSLYHTNGDLCTAYTTTVSEVISESGTAHWVLDEIPAGAYKLVVKMHDEDVLLAGLVESIRIYDSSTVSASPTLNVNKLASGIDFSIIDNTAKLIQGSIEMSFVGEDEVAQESDVVTLTYIPQLPVGIQVEDLHIQWYKDGRTLEDAQTLSLDVTATGGTYRYDVLVSETTYGHAGSAEFTLTVHVEPTIAPIT